MDRFGGEHQIMIFLEHGVDIADIKDQRAKWVRQKDNSSLKISVAWDNTSADGL